MRRVPNITALLMAALLAFGQSLAYAGAGCTQPTKDGDQQDGILTAASALIHEPGQSGGHHDHHAGHYNSHTPQTSAHDVALLDIQDGQHTTAESSCVMTAGGDCFCASGCNSATGTLPTDDTVLASPLAQQAPTSVVTQLTTADPIRLLRPPAIA